MDEIECVHCGSAHVTARGTLGLFQCKTCGRWFEEELAPPGAKRRTKDDNEPTQWE